MKLGRTYQLSEGLARDGVAILGDGQADRTCPHARAHVHILEDRQRREGRALRG